MTESSVLLFENPWYGNPRRHRRKAKHVKRNPMPVVGQFTQGVDMEDAVAAIAGLALSTVIPGMMVRDTTTVGNKWMKVLAGVAVALAAGYGAEMVARGTGKAAVIGGLAGAGVNAINVLRPGTIGAQSGMPLNPGNVVRRRMAAPPQEEFSATRLW